MRKLMASSRPKSSIIMVVDQKTGRQKYHVRNKTVAVSGNELDNTLRYKVIATVLSREIETDVLDLAKRRYRRAIQIYRERINNLLKEVYSNIPDYRDSYVSEIILLMDNNPDVLKEEMALSIKNLIEQKNNGT